MWDGASGGAAARKDEGKNQEEEAKGTDEDMEQHRLAASALASFASNPTTSSVSAEATAAAAAAATARLRAYQEQAAAGYEYPVSQLSSHSLLYQSHAAEALRRQEELQMRQRALYTLQQRQALQRQELQELGYARQLQQQRVAELAEHSRQEAELAARSRQETYDALAGVPASREGMSILEAMGLRAAVPASSEGKEKAAPSSIMDAGGTVPRGKPEAIASAIAAASLQPAVADEGAVAAALAVPSEDSIQIAVPVRSTPAKKKPRKRKASASPGSRARKKAGHSGTLTIDEKVPPITDVEYENVQALMEQFCRVPLLAEFSRPVALLHPELVKKYSKIVTHPIDLGFVCRAIRRREYKNTREIQLDMWRIFANCIKYHTSPSNKDNAVPSFVSIALHLRDYFNALWQEYMVPSDTPLGLASQKSKSPKNIYSKRERDRKKRVATTSATIISAPTLKKSAKVIEEFISMGGRVDKLDDEAIFNNSAIVDGGDMEEVVENLQKLQKKLAAIAETEQDYDVKELDADFRRCYSDLFDDKPSLRIRVGHRIDRLAGRIIVNIFEANSRGVNQSSVWGCMAAAIWARENSKKPYWPALVLGIMAPEDQKEDWHATLTERNERRLPEKLLTDLQTGKRKAEQAIRRQNAGNAEQNSFFLVEFMGTHEFVWVKEADIIETFDPDVDPNQSVAAGNVTKKKRSTRTNDVLGSETFATAREEGRWALEEFELQLNDTCGDLVDDDEDGDQEANYSYSVLCQSDEEAEEEDMAQHSEMGHEMTFSETEEANELLAGDGLLDFSVEGRKNARKRATAAKKAKKAEAEKSIKKEKGGRKKAGLGKRGTTLKRGEKDTDEKREQRELERRRKKRTRERDRVLNKNDSRKKRRTSAGAPQAVSKRDPLADKTGRANAIVKAYLMGISKAEDLKPLGLSGVMAIPAAQLDSTGLLGMALTFRAAAGELDMPDSGDAVSKGKPWENVDVDGPVSAKEREENLSKQKALLENEIKRLKAATQKRKELKIAALAEKRHMIEEVIENDNAVRLSLEKKSKKKPAKKAPTKTEAPDPEKNVETDTEKKHASESMGIDLTLSSKDTGNDEEPASGAASPIVVGEETLEGDDDEDVVEATVVAEAGDA